MYILNNPLMQRGRRDWGKLDKNFFRQNPPLNPHLLAKLKLSDIVQENEILHLETINQRNNINFNLATYMRLCEAVHFYLTSRRINMNNDNSTLRIDTFFTQIKKGSKKIRRVLTLQEENKINVLNTQNIVTFQRLTDLRLENENVSESISGIWNYNFLPNRMREFAFKFFNDILGINTRVSHFNNGHSRLCTFCNLVNVNNRAEETFIHLFFDCFTTSNIQVRLLREFFPELVLNIDSRRKFFFTGIYNEDNTINIFMQIVALTCQYIIWECKLKKKLPSYRSFKLEFFYMLKGMDLCTNFLRLERNKINFLLCRDWHNLRNEL